MPGKRRLCKEIGFYTEGFGESLRCFKLESDAVQNPI